MGPSVAVSLGHLTLLSSRHGDRQWAARRHRRLARDRALPRGSVRLRCGGHVDHRPALGGGEPLEQAVDASETSALEAQLISDALVAQLDLSPSGGPPISDETLEKIDLNWYNPYPELATGGDGAEGEALALLMRQYQTQVAATQLAAVLTAVWKKQQAAASALRCFGLPTLLRAGPRSAAGRDACVDCVDDRASGRQSRLWVATHAFTGAEPRSAPSALNLCSSASWSRQPWWLAFYAQ